MILKQIGWFILWVIPIGGILIFLGIQAAPVLPQNPWFGTIFGWVIGAVASILAWLVVMWQSSERKRGGR